MKNSIVFRTTMMAMFAAISIVLVYLIHFPIIPAAPFLEYDMADVPILLSALLMGTWEGVAVLFVACLIQALTVSTGGGIIGFAMHFIASAVLILTVSLIYRKCGKNTKSLVAGLVLGAIAMTAVMIPLNLVFTGIFMGTGVREVASMLIPVIIPFNIIKAGINCIITGIIFVPVKKIYKRIVH